MTTNQSGAAEVKPQITRAQIFNKRMDDLFYGTPGCWYGSMPKIQADGRMEARGHIALDPEKAAIGIAVLARSFNLMPSVKVGQPEASGECAIIVSFYLKAVDEARALIAGVALREKAQMSEALNAVNA